MSARQLTSAARSQAKFQPVAQSNQLPEMSRAPYPGQIFGFL